MLKLLTDEPFQRLCTQDFRIVICNYWPKQSCFRLLLRHRIVKNQSPPENTHQHKNTSASVLCDPKNRYVMICDGKNNSKFYQRFKQNFTQRKDFCPQINDSEIMIDPWDTKPNEVDGKSAEFRPKSMPKPGDPIDPFHPENKKIWAANNEKLISSGFQGYMLGVAFGVGGAVVSRFLPTFPKHKFKQFLVFNVLFYSTIFAIMGTGVAAKSIIDEERAKFHDVQPDYVINDLDLKFYLREEDKKFE